MTAIVTGGAGYIGGHMVDALVSKGEDVLVLDDFSYGSYVNPKSRVIKVDLRREYPEIEKDSTIYHFAANPDVRTSMFDVREHFERDVLVTLNVMEMARQYDAKKVIFASSSTVYGETLRIPTPEDFDGTPISNYGLFKLMGEEIVEYHAINYGIQGITLRLANITGGRMSHGVVVDFVRKLMKNPQELEILGNGKQKKSYLYISDLINAIFTLEKFVKDKYETFNVGNEDWITVEEIARIVEKEMGLRPKHVYVDGGEGRGWKGDVRFMLLDISKLRGFGWSPMYSSEEAIRLATRDVLNGIKG
ncbi:MAG: NAD-dependent epimerase/dehydratase family protein [Candidatus Aramenus sp.]|jgi:UDP-glucose 4-epimerase|nr:NAD-dependent epimerase/dehydratase family protein [Candidatus Aramenus sp.]